LFKHFNGNYKPVRWFFLQVSLSDGLLVQEHGDRAVIVVQNSGQIKKK
jgi:hypothetical protein